MIKEPTAAELAKYADPDWKPNNPWPVQQDPCLVCHNAFRGNRAEAIRHEPDEWVSDMYKFLADQ